MEDMKTYSAIVAGPWDSEPGGRHWTGQASSGEHALVLAVADAQSYDGPTDVPADELATAIRQWLAEDGLEDQLNELAVIWLCEGPLPDYIDAEFPS